MTYAAQKSTTYWNKVPQVTLVFWLIKMMSTTVGETAADFVNVRLHLGLSGTSVVTGLLLAGLLALQMRSRRYVPARYWSTVVVISVFGTLVTDNLTDRLGVPLYASSLLFAFALAATFALWYACERTLSIHCINTRRRESFYWTAILMTFALGTAVGDWVAEGLGLGFASTGLLFGGLIGVSALAYYGAAANGIVCFWVAYILTRPLGAACGDGLSQPLANGGLGLGTTLTSGVFLTMICALVTYLSVTGHDRIDSAGQAPERA
ncbi:hypothetical protein [Salinisphaera sp. LB1]|uniref:COG4705 family protein n=1 Tax=Salinisphaera sp. LB1 TaxID=2183911 RepID=UPI000D707946|nr:hypothetical protein [Salinisphaera sp. LB1]AWN16114.1 membrane protein [Salinisphaera sp. LB1]